MAKTSCAPCAARNAAIQQAIEAHSRPTSSSSGMVSRPEQPSAPTPPSGLTVGLVVDESAPSVCTLPSATSACRLVSGDMSALPAAVLHTAGRAALIGVGMYASGRVAGMRPTARDVGVYAVGSALAIEVFALAWAAWSQARGAVAR